jgi:hypothetical protein
MKKSHFASSEILLNGRASKVRLKETVMYENSLHDSSAVVKPLNRMLTACPQATGPNSAGWYNNPDNPRFDFRENEDGSILIHSWTGRSVDDILAMIGLSRGDLSRDKHTSSLTHHTLDVVSLAQARRIPWEFLYQLGLSDDYHYKGRRYVKVPYRQMDGTEHTKIRIRKAIDGDYKHCWDEGTPGELLPYGLDKLHMAYEQGYLVIGEGESDGWACWFHDVPYLGLPGASTAKKLTVLGDDLSRIQRIYILHEPDQVEKLQHTGQGFYKDVHNTLRALDYKGELFCVPFKQLTGCKDPGELHSKLWDENPGASTFPAALLQALEQATPAGDDDEQYQDPIEAAIESNDVKEVFKIAPTLARLSGVDYGIAIEQIKEKFGKRVNLNDFKHAVKDEQRRITTEDPYETRDVADIARDWASSHRDTWAFDTAYDVWRSWNGSYWEEQTKKHKLDKEATAALQDADVVMNTQSSLNLFERLAEGGCMREFKSPPGLVNFDNGTLEVTTGRLRDYDKDDNLTYCLPYSYNPYGTHPTIDHFLTEVLPDEYARLA